MAAGSLYQPGSGLGDEALTRLGVLVLEAQGTNDLELSLQAAEVVSDDATMGSFLISFVPENIFASLTQGRATQVVVFALIFGIAVGLVQRQRGGPVLVVLESTFATLRKFTGWLAVLAPFTLAIQIASLLGRSGLVGLLAMEKFIIGVMLVFIVSYIGSVAVICKQSEKSVREVLSALKVSTLFVLSTREAIPAIPFAISGMEEKLDMDRESVDLVIPLSVTLCRFGSIAYFTMVAIFVAELYSTTLGPSELAVVILGSVVASVATSTQSGGWQYVGAVFAGDGGVAVAVGGGSGTVGGDRYRAEAVPGAVYALHGDCGGSGCGRSPQVCQDGVGRR